MTNVLMQRFESLIGSWKLTGRTYDADKDNISGECTFSWLDDGRLQQVSEIRFGEQVFKATEIIHYDAETNTFPAEVYGDENQEPLPYKMDVNGNSMTHSGAGGTYTGMISEDGLTITGSWKPDVGVESHQGNNYTMVMTRVQ